VFHVDIAKVNRDVVYVASVLEARCKRLFINVSSVFQTYVCKRFDLDVAYVLHITRV
jgi:hypothetical protein